MGTATAAILIERWKQAIETSKSKRDALKQRLLNILTKKDDDFVLRIEKFNLEKKKLLSNEHGAGFFWKTHKKEEGYFWQFINWVISYFRKNHPQFGSRLYATLERDVLEPSLNERKEYKNTLDSKKIEELHEMRQEISWSRYLQLLNKQMDTNPNKTALFLYEKTKSNTSGVDEPSLIERQILGEYLMEFVQKNDPLNIQIESIEKLLILMLASPDLAFLEPIFSEKKINKCYLNAWQQEPLSSIFEKYNTISLLEKLINENQRPSKFICLFAELAFEHLLLQYLKDQNNFIKRENHDGYKLTQIIGEKLLNKKNSKNGHFMSFTHNFEKLLAPPRLLATYLPDENFSKQQYSALEIITKIHQMDNNKNLKNEAFGIYKKEHDGQKPKWLEYRIGRYLEKHNEAYKKHIQKEKCLGKDPIEMILSTL